MSNYYDEEEEEEEEKEDKITKPYDLS